MQIDTAREIDRLSVYKGGEEIGELYRTASGCVLQYRDDYFERHYDPNNPHKAIYNGAAYSLPLIQRAYETKGDNLHPFFAGLLPEGLRLRALIKAVKTSADDMFTLLAASGQETVGDVFVSAAEFEDVEALHRSEEIEKLSFYDLFQASIHSREFSARLRDPSIAGVHPKVSAQMVSFPIAVAKRKKRYILKLNPPEIPLLIENENFFMTMARECGLESAATTMVRDRTGEPGLLVERFDRKYDNAAKAFRRLHQEDACQFLNRYPQDKYRLNMREIASAIRRYCTSPKVDILNLIKLKAFSYVICNGDLHGKNISLLEDEGIIKLSPYYDLLSTLPYGDQKMALKLEGRDANIKLNDFCAFGQAFDIPAKAVVNAISSICQKSRPFLDRVHEIGFNKNQTQHLVKAMVERINHLTETSPARKSAK
ncbi:MAG: HipA domain-containing protein [Deltaproteobacteria bacterium]|nr:HipA domain-containing protein [Deltaproteobacteria bacterium]